MRTDHERRRRLGQDAGALHHYAATPLLSRIHRMLTEELAPVLVEQEEALQALARSPDLEKAAAPPAPRWFAHNL